MGGLDLKEMDEQDSAHGVQDHLEHRFGTETGPDDIGDGLQEIIRFIYSYFGAKTRHLGSSDIRNLRLSSRLPLGRGVYVDLRNYYHRISDLWIIYALITNTGVCPDIFGVQLQGQFEDAERKENA